MLMGDFIFRAIRLLRRPTVAVAAALASQAAGEAPSPGPSTLPSPTRSPGNRATPARQGWLQQGPHQTPSSTAVEEVELSDGKSTPMRSVHECGFKERV